MKIKPKSNIEFLENEFYEIIAVHKYGEELYLIQNQELEFNWIESSYFDRLTIEDNEDLTEEKINDYQYYLIPKHLRKENRTIGKERFWKIEGKEFYEKVSFAKNLKNNGFELTPVLNELLINENLRFKIIEEQINSFGKMIALLSDGYFPSLISIEKISCSNEKSDIKIQFRLDFKQMRSDQIPKIYDVADLQDYLESAFEWSYNWVKGFSICKKIFEDNYWNSQIKESINTSINNLLVYSSFHQFEIKEYFLEQADGTEIKLIQMKNEDFITTIRIENVVH